MDVLFELLAPNGPHMRQDGSEAGWKCGVWM